MKTEELNDDIQHLSFLQNLMTHFPDRIFMRVLLRNAFFHVIAYRMARGLGPPTGESYSARFKALTGEDLGWK
jgi:hypothetical protein